jgi:hypothetical protein
MLAGVPPHRVLNRSLIAASGAVEAMGKPSCWCTNATSPAGYCSPGT